MHVILKKNVEELAFQFEYENQSDSKLFEFFCNFCIVSKSFLGRFTPKQVTTNEDDASIDGIAFVINGELILTSDDALEVFNTHKTSLDVEVIFTQIKSGEKFEKKEISNYLLGLKDFFSLSPELPNGTFNKRALEIFGIVLDNLRKVKNKRPSTKIFYCTSGVYKKDKEIEAAFKIIKREIESTDYFHNVSVKPMGRSELLNTWTSITQKNEAKISVSDFFGMPKMKNIPQSYITLIKAKEFVEKLLFDENNNIRNEVFEENIRAFLGENNPVNSEMKNTISSPEKKELFSVLNNGITIVTPELTITANSKEIDLVNYQIINGCQTSNTLFQNYSNLDESVNVVVKFIESSDYDCISDIISATNSQSNIDSTAFHSLKNKAKLVQKYFDIQNENNSRDNHIYFERRENEYKHHPYQQSRIFDIKTLSRAFAAVFLGMPYNSSRYVSKIFQTQGDNLFKPTDQEICYYTAALTLYKFNALANSKKIDAHRYPKMRWHIIHIYKYFVHGEVSDIKPDSKKVSKYCEKILESLQSNDREYEEYFTKCITCINSLPIPSIDTLKRARYHTELIQKVSEFL